MSPCPATLCHLFFYYISPPSALRNGAHSVWMLIGACDPMMHPIPVPKGHLYGGDKHGVLLRVHRRELDAIGTRPPVVLRVLAGRGVVRALALGNGLVYAATARPRATTELGAEILVFTADLSPLCTLVDHVVPMTGILAITVRGADGRVFAGSTCGCIRVW